MRIPASFLPRINADLAADDSTYAITTLAGASATLQATNPPQRLTALFSAAGVAISGRDGAAWQFHLAAIGDNVRPSPVPDVTPIADGARVEYRRGDLTEWYVNGPVEIEQGFTLARSPAGGDTVALALAVTGARPAMADNDVLLTLPSGETQRYAGLAATDARGQSLPARLAVVNDTIRIIVTTAGATWPVTVDPFVETNTFAANDAAANDALSIPVAVDDAVDVVVAAAKHKTISGKVVGEVYVWHIGTPSSSFQIFNPNLNLLSLFGDSVAVSGDGRKVAVGAPNANSDWPGEGLVFVYSAPFYTLTATLRPAPCPCQTTLTGAQYGSGLAMNQTGSIIAIGAPGQSVVIQNHTYPGVGAVYLEYGQGYDSQEVFIGDLPGGPTDRGGEAFGTSVALNTDGATLAVGEPGYDPSGGSAGAIDVFNTSGTSSLLALLTASDAGTADQLGNTVAVSVRSPSRDG